MRAMKDSGVPWIGEIPEGWKVCKTKDVFVRKNEKAHQENPIVLSLARAGVKVRDITKNEGQLAESYSDYNPVEPFDLLLNPMDLYSGANCSISLVRGVISPAYVNLKAKANACPRFYDYYYKTQYWSMAFFAHGKGISFDNRWTLGMDTLFRYNVPLPPLAEQQRIAEFLDRKCAEVDEMIALQERIIEELRAYKQSVITEAVTKGLNPAAPMRDSGIEWIGSIPEHWDVGKMKNIATGFSNGTSTTQLTNEESPYAVTRIETISTGNINYEKVGYVPFFEGINKYELVKGDILISNINSLERVGNSAMYNGEQTLYHGMNLLRVHTNDKMIALYLHYYLRSKAFLEQMKSCCNHAINQVSVSSSTLKNLFVAIPNIADQQAIADYLDEKCADIDSLIQAKLSKIDSLKEYKKSIIYEYVTGKREVE